MENGKAFPLLWNRHMSENFKTKKKQKHTKFIV